MPSTLPIRLSAEAEPGAILFNAYCYLTQIASLYARAAEFDHRPFSRELWSQLSEQMLEDLGVLYSLSELFLKDEHVSSSLQADHKLFCRVKRYCLRADLLIQRLDVWSSSSRWVSVTQRLERKWCSFASEIGLHAQNSQIELKKLIECSRDRHSLLAGLAARLNNEATAYKEITLVLQAQKKG